MFWRSFLLLSLCFSSLLANPIIKIGVLANRNSDMALKEWSATAEYLGKQIENYRFEIVPLNYQELHQHVENKSIDFVLTNTVYYVELEYLYGLSRIATLNNKSTSSYGLTQTGAVILARKESGITTLKELKGKRFGAVDALAFGGWIMAQKELITHGLTSDDFKAFQFFGSHDNVIYALKEGLIDAGTVKTDVLEKLAKNHRIALEDFTILAPKQYPDFPYRVSTELYPEWPFAKLSSTPSSLSNQVAIALLQMPSSSQAAIDANIEGWTIPLDYSKVHTLLQELHLGPYKHLGEISLKRIYEKYALWIYLGLASLMCILGVLAYIQRLNFALKINQSKIESLNEGLEKRVEERTRALHKAYSHEKYLKDVIKTVANVNEILIHSFSTQSVLENCMEMLSKHEQYKFIWVGLIEESVLRVISQSKAHTTFIDERSYHLHAEEKNPLVILAKEAIATNQTVIEKLTHREHEECVSCWVINLPLRAQEHEKPLGSLSVFSSKEDGFEDEEIKMLENLSIDIGMVLHAISQRSMLEIMEEQKLSNYEETILAFVSIIEQRDAYTAGHTLRVAEYCKLIAQEMGLDEATVTKLEKAAVLHDIGKVVTPDAILLKPSMLSPQEYELIKQHSFAGHKMLSQIEMYKDLADIILYHHARFDGKGYPSRSMNDPDPVPLLSYIMAVADAFDAMTTNRIYKPRKSVPEALEDIRLYSGTQFHPDVASRARKALLHVTPNETNQLPTSELEQRRFSYFFMDSLTEVYNENYLKMFLIKQNEEKRCFHLIELKKFSQFNKHKGWNTGNLFLKAFASTLKSSYPDAMIFRYQGDDFVLLFDEHHTITQEEIETFSIVQKQGVSLCIQHHDLKDHVPIL